MIIPTLALAAVGAGVAPSAAGEIPAFARKYRTGCTTCHTAAPKLNVLGEAFRLNGYRFPRNDELLRQDSTVPLGEEPSKELWPRSIWPAELPGSLPVALRIQSDLSAGRTVTGGRARTDFRLPHELYFLGAAAFDRHISTFVEAEWSRDDGVELVQAKVLFQDPIPGLAHRALNLWVGLQNLYLFSFADRQIDRAGRQAFRWQRFRPSDIELQDGSASVRSEVGFQLAETTPAIELNGLTGGGRLAWGLGLAQGAAWPLDNNDSKDVYYRLRYKIGGLALDGTYPAGEGPVLGGQGQLQDRSIILEHFGYLGKEPTGMAGPAGSQGGQSGHLTLGANIRLLHGPLDLGAGYVWARHDDPWGAGGGPLTYRSLFAKGEVMIFPWLIGSLKLERFRAALPASPLPGFQPVSPDETGLFPGMVALLRQNLRLVVEGQSYLVHAASSGQGLARPGALWIRLDLAF